MTNEAIFNRSSNAIICGQDKKLFHSALDIGLCHSFMIFMAMQQNSLIRTLAIATYLCYISRAFTANDFALCDRLLCPAMAGKRGLLVVKYSSMQWFFFSLFLTPLIITLKFCFSLSQETKPPC